MVKRGSDLAGAFMVPFICERTANMGYLYLGLSECYALIFFNEDNNF